MSAAGNSMASLARNTSFRAQKSVRKPASIQRPRIRYQSTTATHTIIPGRGGKEKPETTLVQSEPLSASPLARLSTSSILRTLFLSAFFTSPILFNPGLAIFDRIARSPSPWLNPDRNPLLRAAIYPLVYKQFCAGRSQREIGQTSAEVRRLGFSGIVLCYGKEVQVRADKLEGYSGKGQSTMDAEICQWADGNLETLDMVDRGDWLGIKSVKSGCAGINC